MKLSYENNFKSQREDGRFTSSMAAHMEYLRNYKPKLAMPENMNTEEFNKWREAVKEKLTELLCMPEVTPQPEPKMVSRVQRDGYSVERWELYPDDYAVVPILVLIPDGVSAEHKAPGVMCLPGSIFSKEFLAGEELLERKSCRFEKYPERNRMALHTVKNGMVAFAFDHPEIAECSLGDELYTTRTQMCFGYLFDGINYPGISVFQKLCCLRFIKQLDYVDQNRLAVCAHSLGTMPAAFLGLLCDEIKAVVFNDFVCDVREKYVCITEEEEQKMDQHIGDWHIIPGMWKWFANQDILAALAPKFLALNEGGAGEYINTIKKAYDLFGAEDRLQVTQYPKYADPKTRIYSEPIPKYGLTSEEYYERSYVDAPDHSFRPEPSIRLLKKCFGI